MSKILKLLLIVLFIVAFYFNFCYAIDENTIASQNSASTNSSQNKSSNSNASNDNSESVSTTSTSKSSTTSSSVSKVDTITDSGSSTISNIINIALIVIGILLIFFAIAILIRLSHK